jgi:type II secretory pathway predicted ATPase ExeA
VSTLAADPSVQRCDLAREPDFPWLGEPYQGALAALRAAVRTSPGLLLLTGEAGTGKTILTKTLVQRLRNDGALVGTRPLSPSEPGALPEAVAVAYGLPGDEAFRAGFEEFLSRTAADRKSAVFIIDDADRLTPDTIRTIEDLLETAASGSPRRLFSILLVGGPGLEAMLGSARHKRLGSRITTRCQLRRLTDEEVAAFLVHRLAVAGVHGSPFKPATVRDIHRASGGLASRIGPLAQQALAPPSATRATATARAPITAPPTPRSRVAAEVPPPAPAVTSSVPPPPAVTVPVPPTPPAVAAPVPPPPAVAAELPPPPLPAAPAALPTETAALAAIGSPAAPAEVAQSVRVVRSKPVHAPAEPARSVAPLKPTLQELLVTPPAKVAPSESRRWSSLRHVAIAVAAGAVVVLGSTFGVIAHRAPGARAALNVRTTKPTTATHNPPSAPVPSPVKPSPPSEAVTPVPTRPADTTNGPGREPVAPTPPANHANVPSPPSARAPHPVDGIAKPSPAPEPLERKAPATVTESGRQGNARRAARPPRVVAGTEAPTSRRAPDPSARVAEPRPDAARPSTPSRADRDTPDPSGIIDWLLKDRPPADASLDFGGK